MKTIPTISPTVIARLKKTGTELRDNWIVAVSFRFSAVLFFISLALILWRWNGLPPAIPLWYSKPWGSEQLAHPMWLFILPLGNLLWYLVDVAIIMWQNNRYRIFTQTIFLATFLSSFLSFVTLVKILFLIT